MGVVALTRPLDAVVIAAVVGIWAVTLRIGRLRVAVVAALALGSLAVAGLTLPYNRHFTGSGTTFPLTAYTEARYGPGSNAMGFGPERGFGWSGLDPFPGHGPVDVVVNAFLNSAAINTELLGWGAGSLLLVVVGLTARRRTKADWALVAAIGCVILLYSLYWFAGGPDFGARYWFLTVVPLVVLAARGAISLDARGGAGPPGRVHFTVLALGLSLISVVTFLPWRALDKYHGYRGMDAGIQRLAEEAPFGPDLVLIQGSRHPDYHSAAIYNPLDWDAEETIYAWDRSPEVRRAVLEAYPDRKVWLVEGPSLTGGGHRIVEGPVDPGPDCEQLLR